MQLCGCNSDSLLWLEGAEENERHQGHYAEADDHYRQFLGLLHTGPDARFGFHGLA